MKAYKRAKKKTDPENGAVFFSSNILLHFSFTLFLLHSFASECEIIIFLFMYYFF